PRDSDLEQLLDLQDAAHGPGEQAGLFPEDVVHGFMGDIGHARKVSAAVPGDGFPGESSRVAPEWRPRSPSVRFERSGDGGGARRPGLRAPPRGHQIRGWRTTFSSRPGPTPTTLTLAPHSSS